MEPLIPASKIANLNAGEIVGIVSRENNVAYGDYHPNVFNCKITLDNKVIELEKKQYKELPEFYTFGSTTDKNYFLLKNMQKIFSEVESILL